MHNAAVHWMVRHVLFVLCASSVSGKAGVTLDGTLGPGGSLSGSMTIPATVGRQVGGNLFHSFSSFNILTGESLYFTPTGSSAAISNVISRVTGGGLSNIDGVLGSTIPGANVFLINPGGIAFGPNARLDVSGSFYASTANYLKLADGGRFDASLPANTVLTVAPPAAFGFLGPTPAGITVSGSILEVPTGRSLGLIGGDITLRNGAFFAAPGGVAHLVSTASVGEATFATGAFDVGSFAALGTIAINGGMVDASEVFGAGTVYIRGGRLVLDQASIFSETAMGNSGGVDMAVSGDITATGALIGTATFGPGRGGDIHVTAAGTISMDASTINTSDTSGGVGDAGSILIHAGNLSLTNNARFNSFGNFYTGRAGDIHVTVAGTMSMDASTITTSNAISKGDAGNVSIHAGSLSLTNDARIDSSGNFYTGRGGNIIIDAIGSVSLDNSRIASGTLGDGDAGSIRISTADLKLSNNTIIDGGSAFGGGRSGDITLTATDSMSMTKFSNISSSGNIVISAGNLSLVDNALIDTTGGFAIGPGGEIAITIAGTMAMDNSSIKSLALGSGAAGNVRINTGNLSLANGSEINTSGNDTFGTGPPGNIAIAAKSMVSMDNSRIMSGTSSDQDAGNILVSAHNVTLTNGAEINSSSNFGAGRGGDITLNATDTISMSDFANVSSVTYGYSSGAAGNIKMGAANIKLGNRAEINSSTGSLLWGSAGAIVLDARDQLQLTGTSGISSGTVGYAGKGGTVDVRAGRVSVTEGSFISTATGAWGQGGSINIHADILDIGDASGLYSAVSASTTSLAADAGRAGNVSIDARVVRLQGGGQITSDTHGRGQGGNVSIIADEVEVRGVAADGNIPSLISAASLLDAPGAGNAGNVSIHAGRLRALDGGQIHSGTFGTGHGGSVTIEAGYIEVRGAVPGGFHSAIGASSIKEGESGNAGDVSIGTGDMAVRDGGSIQTSTRGSGSAGTIALRVSGGLVIGGASDSGNFSGVTSQTNGAGRGGSIEIEADRLSIFGGAFISSGTRNDGTGGEIRVAANEVDLTGSGSGIFARSRGSGDAGRISLFASDRLLLRAGAVITTEATNADGGNIDIRAGKLIYLKDSEITTSVGTGTGNGGNITIDPDFVVLNNSRIIANAFGGNGGNIAITAGNLFRSPESVISASSQLGISGSVVISSPIVDLAGSLESLPASYLDAGTLLAERCAARIAGNASSFVVAGRGGVPVEPDGWLSGAATIGALVPADKISAIKPVFPLLASFQLSGCTR